MTDTNGIQINLDLWITNEILLNICSWFETFYNLNANLFTTAPLSPKDWINELSSTSMSPNLNSIILNIIQLCGIKSRNDIPKQLSYLPNHDLKELLLNECLHREHQFMLYCDKDPTMEMDCDDDDDEEEDVEDEFELNEYGIVWQRVQYHQLPFSYKLSILLNFCDWILLENKAVRKLMNCNKKALKMKPIFIDDDKRKYYLFGSESLASCLLREKEEKDATVITVYGIDEYVFESQADKMDNNGVYFGDLECVAIGMQGIKEFAVTIDRIKKAKLYDFMLLRINAMEIVEKKKLREDRRKKMRQQKFEKEFAYKQLITTYEDNNGNRRSTRRKDKEKVNYKEDESEEEQEEEQEESDTDNKDNQEEDKESENDEPRFYPSGRQKRQSTKQKVTYRY